ncbi:alpha/beta hydrolase [Rugamonas apoptosis]|uniref:Alpha/beta fold hydrolase n=1 Tax=Rugamonas apoptosis TaxID=2758570 RepID=A0A7W2FFC5_9BURK|nr:alpha/beta fold hydrolase [Rugamonas apoptosis]MBA5690703.1 alpha/beta fold hydrolase [Rugamonas apoptosis]
MLLIHGLLSSPQEFGLIAHGLRNRGTGFDAISVPDYTLAYDPITPNWKRWLEGASAAIDARVDAGEPVILGGLCMGGILAAAAALRARQRIAGLILMSPTFTFDGWGMHPIRHLRRLGYMTGLDRFFSMYEREPYGVKNPKIRKWIMRELRDRAQSAAGPARVPLRALREAERMLSDVTARLHELDCPLLFIHARDDEITRLSSVEQVFSTLPQTNKELLVLDNSYHMITIDNDREQVSRALEHFARRVRLSE